MMHIVRLTLDNAKRIGPVILQRHPLEEDHI